VIKQECTYSGQHNVAAIICEPWARRGGTPKGWLPRIKQICAEYEILFIDDEITTGAGRSGKWWVCEHENVVPDLMTAGKGLSSGVPVSFVIGSNEIMDQLPKSINEAQTFGMVPLAAAAITATIKSIQNENMIDNVNKVGHYIQTRLDEIKLNHPFVGDAPSLGFEFSMDLIADPKTKTPLPREIVIEIFRNVWEQGILTYGAFTFFTPALVLTQEHAETSFNIIEACLNQIEKTEQT
jgi:4-aminobutyrate aminotransferase-like enzyme